MTITATTNTFTVTSTLLELADTHTVTLRYRYNCNAGATIAVEEEDVTVDEITLTPASLGMTSVFSEGVYFIEIKAVPVSGNTQTETYILYYAPTIPCELIAYYADKGIDCLNERPCDNNEYFWAYVFHDLLLNANTCSEFTYEKTCTLWEALTAIIGTTNNGDCGCN